MSCCRSSGWVPRCSRVSAVCDVVVSTPPAMRFQRMLSSCSSSRRWPSNSNWMRKLVRSSAGFGSSGRRELEDVLHHGGDLGDGVGVLGAVLGDGHDGVEEVGVEVPVVVGQAHQLHGEDGRDRAGVVEHEVHLPVADSLIEELVGRLLHERLASSGRRPGRRTGPGRALGPGGRGRRLRRCPAPVGLRDVARPSRPGSRRRRQRSARICARRCRRLGAVWLTAS